MQNETNREGRIQLDRLKLLGFRNLGTAEPSEVDTRTKAEVAFNKIGFETG